MPDFFDPEVAASIVVHQRLARRWRGTSIWRKRIPKALIPLFDLRSRRRATSNAVGTTTLVTVCIGSEPCPALERYQRGANHVCFTDSPERLPAYWTPRPLEYWGATDQLTRKLIHQHLPRLFTSETEIIWVEPEPGSDGTPPLAVDETSTGSGRWFGDQLVARHPRTLGVAPLPVVEADAAAIVVPVHNAPDEVRRCLDAVVRTMRDKDRLIIVDDGSALPTASLCEQYTRFDRVSLLRRESGSGFPAAANAGIEQCSEPFVIVLNSDTTVPRDWIRTLLAHLQRIRHAAAVGPMSNAARFQSIPYLSTIDDARNSLPSGFDIEYVNTFLRAWSEGVAPIRVPLLNGFCMAFRRSALDEIGLFDTTGFPRGFGEENDWCRRAIRGGFDLLVATDVYVHHAKGRSYPSDEVENLKAAASRVLTERYGRASLDADLTAMRYPAALVALRADTQALWSALEGRISLRDSV